MARLTRALAAAGRWVDRNGRRVGLAWVLAGSVAIAVLLARDTGEDTRVQQAVVEQVRAEQTRQAAEAERRTKALCADWKGRAEADLMRSSTELGRSLVRTAAANYELVGCARFTGPLGTVDAEAYQPAPPPPQ